MTITTEKGKSPQLHIYASKYVTMLIYSRNIKVRIGPCGLGVGINHPDAPVLVELHKTLISL